jgi:hypothetical protein
MLRIVIIVLYTCWSLIYFALSIFLNRLPRVGVLVDDIIFRLLWDDGGGDSIGSRI